MNNKNMATFIVAKKLSIKQALDCMGKVEKWFRENPRRKICNTDYFSIRKGFLVSDVLEHTESI